MKHTRENPYVGPRAFTTEDQQKFAGRERDVTALYRLLIAERIVLLFSPSGAGKSSLVNAGLGPRMMQKGFKMFPTVRVNLLPTDLPNQGKGNRYVISMLQSLEGGGTELSNEQLAGTTINDYLTECLHPRNTSDPNSEEMLEPKSFFVFDQFEEILTVDPNDYKGKQEFFSQLGEALEAPQRWALFVVREDYVAALDPYLRFLPTRLGNRYRLDLLDADSATEAIRKPASLMKVSYTDEAAEHLVNELRSVRIQLPDGSWEPEPQLGRYVEPVQLQVVCHRLWENLDEDDTITKAEVTQMGSVDESLAGYYADKVAETATAEGVNASEKDIRTWFDSALITANNIRSQVMWEKEKSGGLDDKAIEKLEKTHLIRREARRGVMWLELAHDRLIKPIRDDNKAWFEKNLSVLQRQAMVWSAEDEPERLLLRYDALEDAEEWAKDKILSTNEQKFLEASQALRARVNAETELREQAALEATNRRLRLRSRIAIFAALVAAVLLLVVLQAESNANSEKLKAEQSAREAAVSARNAQLKKNEADQNAQKADENAKKAQQAQAVAEYNSLVSDASQLSAQSRLFADTNPQLATLLALEALNTTKRNEKPALPVAQGALYAALNSQSGFLLSGHNGHITTIAFSNDEHWLATADDKGFIRIWDLTASDPSDTKSLLKDMEGIPVTNIQFSPDGKYFVASGSNGYIFLWQLPEGPGKKPFLLPYSQSFFLNAISDEEVSVMAFSPDGTWFAAGGSRGRVVLFQVSSFNSSSAPQPRILPTSGVSRIMVLKFSPDSTKLAAGSQDSLARLWSLNNPQNTPNIQTTQGAISSLDFTPDGAYLAIGGDDQTIRLWNVNSPSNPPDNYQKTLSKITVLAFDPNEATGQSTSAAASSSPRQLFVGHADGSIEIWRGSGRTLVVPSDKDILRVIDSEITQFSFSPDGHWLLTSSKDRSARLFDVTDLNSAPRVLRRFADPVTGALISPKGTWIAVSSDNNEARLWNLGAGLDTVEPLSLPGGPFALQGKGKLLATGPTNENLPPVLLWNFADLDQLKKIYSKITSGDSSSVRMGTLAISPDGHWLTACAENGQAYLKDLQNADSKLDVLNGRANNSGFCGPAIFTPDGHYLVVVENAYNGSNETGILEFWDLSKPDFAKTTPETLNAYEGHFISALAFSSDGQWMATGSDGGSDGYGIARLWDMKNLSNGDAALTIRNHIGDVETVAFSPDGQWLVTGDDNGDLRFQTLNDLKSPFILKHAHEVYVNTVAFSSDSKTLASGSSDGTIRLWSLLNDRIGDKVFTFSGHEGPVLDLAFSPDNKWLASASSDNTVRLWNWSERSTNAIILSGYRDAATHVAFTGDGRWLITGSIDGTTRLWHMDLDQLQEIACQVVGRNLTQKEWDQFINTGSGTPNQNVAYLKTCPQYQLVNNLAVDETIVPVTSAIDTITVPSAPSVPGPAATPTKSGVQALPTALAPLPSVTSTKSVSQSQPTSPAPSSAVAPTLIVGQSLPTSTAVPATLVAAPLPTLSFSNCSTEGSTPINVTFANNGATDVDVYWVDYGCNRVYYATIQAGESYVQGTYVTHVWEFVDPTTGKVLKTYTAGKEGDVVSIP